MRRLRDGIDGSRSACRLPLGILAGAIFAALVGALVELVVIRHLYDRPLDTIVATWGLSLIATQGTLILVGIRPWPASVRRSAAFRSATIPIPSIASCCSRLRSASWAALYMLFNWTRFGVLARATIQVPHMAAALGVDTRLVYSLTFACGAGLAGLAGGLYAPTMTLVPTMGATFIMEAFVTVVIGGADVFLGTAPAGAVLAVVQVGDDILAGPVVRPDRPPGCRDHRHPGPAEGYLRFPVARTHLKDPTQ